MAKKSAFIISLLILTVSLTGCGKKQLVQEEEKELTSMEELTKLDAPAVQTASESETSQAQLEPLPPSGPYKPTAQEIQKALANANYYKGIIDGKIGPLTKKAIEEFQKANGLEADGKVGPKTWAALNTYLSLKPQSEKR